MAARTDLITAAEAAVIARITVADVHRAFDEHLLPDTLLSDTGGRRIARAAVPLLAFYFGTAKVLQAEARRQVIGVVTGGGKTGAVARLAALRRRRKPLPVCEGVTVDLGRFVADADARDNMLARARAMVVTDPELLAGSEPVVRGTRVPVYNVAASVAAGETPREILASYPSLRPEHIELAVLYAAAEPPRGRPRRPLADRLPAGARLIASGFTPRSPIKPPRSDRDQTPA